MNGETDQIAVEVLGAFEKKGREKLGEIALDILDQVDAEMDEAVDDDDQERILKLAMQMVRDEKKQARSRLNTPKPQRSVRHSRIDAILDDHRFGSPRPPPPPSRRHHHSHHNSRHNSPVVHQPPEETNSASLSGIGNGTTSESRHSHRYKCCCCEMDGPVINYGGKLTIGLCVLFFCFVQIHRSSEDFATYVTLISAVLGVFISTPKMKRQREP